MLNQGPNSGTFPRSGAVAGCLHNEVAAYRFAEKSCVQCDATAQGLLRRAAKARGLRLAKDLPIGSWVLVEARADPDEVFWLGRTVAVDGWGGACTKKVKESHHHKGVRYDDGDVIVAVQWYKRLSGHSAHRTYQREQNTTGRPWTDYSNSCELWLINADMGQVGGPSLPACAGARARPLRGPDRAAEEDREAQRLWALAPESEAMALAECR